MAGDEAITELEMLEVMARLGFDIRREHLGGGGSRFCTLGNKPVFFVDVDADGPTRRAGCLSALAARPDLEKMYLPPALREAIARYRD